MKAPFPCFGGKSTVAPDVWEALGQPAHYIKPFFGSGAVLLNRPNWSPAYTETINDADGFVANVWRALQANPDAVCRVCDWPVNHADLIARKARLVSNEGYLLENLCRDDKWFDAELAGYWIWAASCWIGSGLTRPGQIPHLSSCGIGVHAVSAGRETGNSANVQEPYNTNLYKWFRELSKRLRYVRVVCGDWTRVCGGKWQSKMGVCGMFFDPPYGVDDRDSNIYQCESLTVAGDVRTWCQERCDDPMYRIVLAGYFEEHEVLLRHGWTHKTWTAAGGYGNTARDADAETQGKTNRFREALFFSPHCLNSQKQQLEMF